jgi:hypothetical protein
LNAPMTAAELAKMIEGWPEMDGFRVVKFEGGIELKIGKMRFAQYFDAPVLAPEVVLPVVCMSGLRHLANSHRVEIEEQAAETWLWLSGASDYFKGPTLLHAIDAAVRATGAT